MNAKLIGIILILGLITSPVILVQVFAQTAEGIAFLSNVILTPGVVVVTVVSANEIDLITSTANKRNQSPFHQLDPGVYTITITPIDGFNLVKAKCTYQKPNGVLVSIGTWDGAYTVDDVELKVNVAQKCTWKFAPIPLTQ